MPGHINDDEYDEMNVGEVKQNLSDASKDDLSAIREYERDNKDRDTVIDAVDSRLNDFPEDEAEAEAEAEAEDGDDAEEADANDAEEALAEASEGYRESETGKAEAEATADAAEAEAATQPAPGTTVAGTETRDVEDLPDLPEQGGPEEVTISPNVARIAGNTFRNIHAPKTVAYTIGVRDAIIQGQAALLDEDRLAENRQSATGDSSGEE